MLVSINSGYLCENHVISIEDPEVVSENLEYNELTLQEDEYIEAEQEAKEEDNFIKPLTNGAITSYFGMRYGKLHTGIDIADNTGTEIYASKSGNVIYSGWSNGYGKLVIVQHCDGYETYYAHCSSILVSVGDYVEQGQIIAKVGMTGNATGPHVHFEIRINGSPVNPYSYIY